MAKRQADRLDQVLSKVLMRVKDGEDLSLTGKFSEDFPAEWVTILRVTGLYEEDEQV